MYLRFLYIIHIEICIAIEAAWPVVARVSETKIRFGFF